MLKLIPWRNTSWWQQFWILIFHLISLLDLILRLGSILLSRFPRRYLHTVNSAYLFSDQGGQLADVSDRYRLLLLVSEVFSQSKGSSELDGGSIVCRRLRNFRKGGLCYVLQPLGELKILSANMNLKFGLDGNLEVKWISTMYCSKISLVATVAFAGAAYAFDNNRQDNVSGHDCVCVSYSLNTKAPLIF